MINGHETDFFGNYLKGMYFILSFNKIIYLLMKFVVVSGNEPMWTESSVSKRVFKNWKL